VTRLIDLLRGDRRDPRIELREVFGETGSVDRPDSAPVLWARGVLDSHGVAREDRVRAIRELRRAERRLGLKSATYLAAITTR